MPLIVARTDGYTTPIPVVWIGGSVTQAGDASDTFHTYVDLVSRWVGLHTYHPISWVNSGIGGHTSWTNLVRLAADVVALSPAIVVWDAAANDLDDDGYKAAAEGFVRRIRTALPNCYIIGLSNGRWNGWAANDPTLSNAAVLANVAALYTAYDVLAVDAATYISGLVTAGTRTLPGDILFDDMVHLADGGMSAVFDLLHSQFMTLFPSPVAQQWSGDLGDYPYVYDDGSYENAPQVINATSANSETGTWATVNTTERQSSTPDSTITFIATCQSFGLTHGVAGGVIQYSVDGGEYSASITLATWLPVGQRIWYGTRAAHTIAIKVISGTVNIKTFVAI